MPAASNGQLTNTEFVGGPASIRSTEAADPTDWTMAAAAAHPLEPAPITM